MRGYREILIECLKVVFIMTAMYIIAFIVTKEHNYLLIKRLVGTSIIYCLAAICFGLCFKKPKNTESSLVKKAFEYFKTFVLLVLIYIVDCFIIKKFDLSSFVMLMIYYVVFCLMRFFVKKIIHKVE